MGKIELADWAKALRSGFFPTSRRCRYRAESRCCQHVGRQVAATSRERSASFSQVADYYLVAHSHAHNFPSR